MTRSAKVRRFFGDADHDFALRIGEVEELQEELDCGLIPTLTRCTDIDVKAIRSVLRLGLVGGGMKKEPAFRLVQRHVAPGYLTDVASVAGEVVRAALLGAGDEPAGEPVGEAETDPPTSPTASSGSLASTGSAPSSDGAPRTSSEPHSGSSAPRSRGGKRLTAPKKAAGG